MQTHSALRAVVASALGNDYHCTPKAIVHAPTGIEFVLIPGGMFVAGMRPTELELMRALEYVEGDALEIVEGIAETNPPRVVTVPPFLCARAPIGARTRFTRDEAARVVTQSPFRLLTADEWEWVARDGGRLPFVNGSTPSEAADACRALYDHEYDPERDDEGTNLFGVWGLPWGCFISSLEERGGAARAYPWQSDEIIMALCAFGDTGSTESCVRFALDLPDIQAYFHPREIVADPPGI